MNDYVDTFHYNTASAACLSGSDIRNTTLRNSRRYHSLTPSHLILLRKSRLQYCISTVALACDSPLPSKTLEPVFPPPDPSAFPTPQTTSPTGPLSNLFQVIHKQVNPNTASPA